MEHIATATVNLQDSSENPDVTKVELNGLTSSSEICSHWSRPSHSRSSGVPCGVASDERWQQR